MVGVGEHVDRGDRLEPVADRGELRGVGGEGRGVARHIDDALGAEQRHALDGLLGHAGARRVGEHHRGALEGVRGRRAQRLMGLAVVGDELGDLGVAAARRVEQRRRTSAGHELEVGGAGELGVLGGRRDGVGLQLEAVHDRRLAGEQQAEPADAAVQVVGAPPGLRPGGAQGGLVEHAAHLGVGLQERQGRHAQAHAGELFVEVGRPHDHERTRRRPRRRSASR